MSKRRRGDGEAEARLCRKAHLDYHYVPASPQELAECRRLEQEGQVEGQVPYWMREDWPNA